jgi:hypothetical protein
MPIATLKFKLPEEQDDFKLANNGHLYYIILHELDQELRAFVKYGDNDNKSEELAQKWRDRLNELCREYNVDL